MKRIMMIFLTGFILLLSGCMNAESPQDEVASVYGNIYYDSDTMSFTNTSEIDIFYKKGDTYFDFVYTHDRLMDTTLTSEEKLAYQHLFIITDQIVNNSNIDYAELMTLSSSEFKTACDNLSIEIGLDDIVVFNSLKQLVETIGNLPGSSSVKLVKLTYLELRLDITLTEDEKESLELLQELYNELYERTYQYYDIEANSLEDLLVKLEVELDFVPDAETLAKLETAYDLITGFNID